MNLINLMTKLVSNGRSGFTVRGAYGIVAAWPDDSKRNGLDESTYWVDAVYFAKEQSEQKHLCQSGFRLSTVCCICTCVCVGENSLDDKLIEYLNSWFVAE